jgi:hypothetical protein
VHIFHFALSFHRDTFSDSTNKLVLVDCTEKRHATAIFSDQQEKNLDTLIFCLMLFDGSCLLLLAKQTKSQELFLCESI